MSNRVYSVEKTRLLEKNCGQSQDDLMYKAGAFGFKVLEKYFDDFQKLLFVCGPGNNGGDGFICAALAAKAGKEVYCFEVGNFEKQTLIAKKACQFALDQGIRIVSEPDLKDTLIVDALLGIGIRGEVRESEAKIIRFINESDCPVLSLDVPSGLDADSGMPLGTCVKADVTATFLTKKQGLYFNQGKDFCGVIEYNNLDVDLSSEKSEYLLLEEKSLLKLEEKRIANVDKSVFGHLLLVSGPMKGAILMAGMAALRSGAGKVTVASETPIWQFPELMFCDYEQLNLTKKSAIVIGPGMARVFKDDFIKGILESPVPKVIDADCLNWLSRNPDFKPKNCVLTPHSREAARLLNVTEEDVLKDRKTAVLELYNRYNETIVLKGCATLIKGSTDEIYLCPFGNSGLAKGGTGDILAGMIAGILVQGFTCEEAAKLGVLLHALSSDLAVQDTGKTSLLATDLLDYCSILELV